MNSNPSPHTRLPRLGEPAPSTFLSAAATALRWPLNLWLETALWVTLALSIGIAYATSYANLIHVAGAIGYGAWERNAVAVAVDAPLTAAVLGQLLAARWHSPWWVKAMLGLLGLATAPATILGNALNAALAGDAFDWSRVDALHLVAFSVPGAVVVLVALVATMMLGQRAALTERALVPAVATGGNASRKSSSRKPSQNLRLSRNGRPPAHQPPPELDDVMARMLGRGDTITASSLSRELGVGRATAGRYLQQRRAIPQAETR